MGAQTGIEWTDATWNPVGGCEILTPGCTNCYAMQLAANGRLRNHPVYRGTTRIVNGHPVWNGTLTRLPDDHKGWSWPLAWRGAKDPVLGAGKPSLIFVEDMADLFHADRPRRDIDRTIGAVIYSKHIGQLLTKRADVMADYFQELRASRRMLDYDAPPGRDIPSIRPKLWLGVSVERQQEADARRESLERLSKMGFTTFVSYEPALGPVDWSGWEFIDQIISGGESGKDARPSHPDWHRATRDWCAANGIAYFFKQWGEFGPADLRGFSHEMPTVRTGKKAAGRLLDGIEHNGMPEGR